MRRLVFLTASLVSCGAFAGNTFAGPLKIGYAGCSTQASGQPVPDGNATTVIVRLYDGLGGSPLKETTFPGSVSAPTFTKGCFAVELDISAVPRDLLDQPLFLELAIGSDTFPRIPFDSVPYSLWAGAVHWADVRDRPNLVNTLAVGSGLLLRDGGVGDVRLDVDYGRVQTLLLPDGTCAPPNFVKSIDPVTGAMSCGFAGAPTVTVGPGLLVGSDGGLNGGTANFSVTGGDLSFGLNLPVAGGNTATGTIPLLDAGVLTLTVANGSSNQVARADHRHLDRVWLGPDQFELLDVTENPTTFNAVKTKWYSNSAASPQFAMPVILLGSLDSATAVIALPPDVPVSKIAVRLFASCPGSFSGMNYTSGSPSCNVNFLPQLRYAAGANYTAFATYFNATGGNNYIWSQATFPGLLGSAGKQGVVTITPMRLGWTYCCGSGPATSAQAGDLLLLQLSNSNTGQTSGAWQIEGLELTFVP